MSKVFFSITLSLDGFIAPAGMDMEHADNPGYKDWKADGKPGKGAGRDGAPGQNKKNTAGSS